MSEQAFDFNSVFGDTNVATGSQTLFRPVHHHRCVPAASLDLNPNRERTLVEIKLEKDKNVNAANSEDIYPIMREILVNCILIVCQRLSLYFSQSLEFLVWQYGLFYLLKIDTIKLKSYPNK